MWCPDTSDILANRNMAALIHDNPLQLLELPLVLLSSSTMKSHSKGVPVMYTSFMHCCAELLVCIDCFWRMFCFQFAIRRRRMIPYILRQERFSISTLTGIVAGSLLELCVLDPKCKDPVVPEVCSFLSVWVLHIMNLGSSRYCEVSFSLVAFWKDWRTRLFMGICSE